MPFFSIITINYNNAADLQKTFDSVFAQSFTSFEYLVIDGGSSDGSREMIERNNSKINYWVSEKDNGVFHAMNKGIDVATGNYLLFLNSGDIFASPDVLEKVAAPSFTEDIIYGDIIWQKSPGVTTIAVFPDRLNFEFFFKNSLPHQGSFISRALFDKFGKYNETHKIISDWRFFVETICRHNVSYHHLPEIISICDQNGISCSPVYFDQIIAEKQQVLKEQFPAFWNEYQELFLLRNKLRKATASAGFKLHKKIRSVLGLRSGINSI